jgi:hypothetical protein
MSALLLQLVLLATCQTLPTIKYTFDQIYDTQIVDTSQIGYHADKPAAGTAACVNTPSGLFSKSQFTMFPSTYFTSFPHSQTFTVTFLVRIIDDSLNTNRNLLTIKTNLAITWRLLKNPITSLNQPAKFQLTGTVSSVYSPVTTNSFPNVSGSL